MARHHKACKHATVKWQLAYRATHLQAVLVYMLMCTAQQSFDRVRTNAKSGRVSVIPGVLATAILAQQHSDVWDAAAMLLREHAGELPSQRQASLLETLAAAASLMSPAQKSRAGPG